MDVAGVLRVAYRGSHQAVREAMDELDPNALFWRPAPDANHAGFLLWHLVRDEDVIVQGELMGRPQAWVAGRWFERFDLPQAPQGTGYAESDIARMRFSLDDLASYAEDVWRATYDALADVAADALLRPVPGGSMLDLLLTGSIGHNWVHLGEVRALMGLRGWRFRE